MKLDDKRKVIEVLMCCGDPGSGDGTTEACTVLGLARHYQRAAWGAWSPVEAEPGFANDWSRDGISLAYSEAAYRLIELSPTLRREWFGKL